MDNWYLLVDYSVIISILTLFPDLFPRVLNCSITGRAQKKDLVTLRYINIRDFAIDDYGTVDDKPYGGGVGMIMRVDVVDNAIQHALTTYNLPPTTNHRTRRVLLDPAGKQFRQSTAKRYSKLDHLILVCGHYEGVDARIHDSIDERISVGPYVLTGGEIPAMLITDSVVRLLPGVLPPDATEYESFSKQYDHEPPQYTRPEVYNEKKVPEILLSGNHAAIQQWKREQGRK